MLEIYNEQVRDLLVKEKPPHGGLKIRQNPKTGFYVEGLKVRIHLESVIVFDPSEFLYTGNLAVTGSPINLITKCNSFFKSQIKSSKHAVTVIIYFSKCRCVVTRRSRS